MGKVRKSRDTWRDRPVPTVSGRPFDPATVEAVWKKAKVDPGYTIFKKDSCGATIQRDSYGKTDT
jgi:hypothetical protein